MALGGGCGVNGLSLRQQAARLAIPTDRDRPCHFPPRGMVRTKARIPKILRCWGDRWHRVIRGLVHEAIPRLLDWPQAPDGRTAVPLDVHCGACDFLSSL